MSTIHIPSLAYLHDAAQEFLRAVGPAPRVVAFYGEMGAGKTTFIKALCEALGVRDAINSPTFAIVNEYVGRDADTTSTSTASAPLPKPSTLAPKTISSVPRGALSSGPSASSRSSRPKPSASTSPSKPTAPAS